MVWGHGFGLIAILIEVVGLGSEFDGVLSMQEWKDAPYGAKRVAAALGQKLSAPMLRWVLQGAEDLS
jgi:hypothetical protein